jgi:hypothetical protein
VEREDNVQYLASPSPSASFGTSFGGRGLRSLQPINRRSLSRRSIKVLRDMENQSQFICQHRSKDFARPNLDCSSLRLRDECMRVHWTRMYKASAIESRSITQQVGTPSMVYVCPCNTDVVFIHMQA